MSTHGTASDATTPGTPASTVPPGGPGSSRGDLPPAGAERSDGSRAGHAAEAGASGPHGAVFPAEAEALERKLDDADTETMRAFWSAAAEHGTPMLMPHPEDPDRHRATFLWRDETAAAVHLHVNRVTDKEDHDRGRMRRIAGTDAWVLTLDLPRTLRCSYGFTPSTEGEVPPQGPPELGVHRTFADPLNPAPPLRAEGPRGLSICSGAQAPEQPEWSPMRQTSAGRPAPSRLRRHELRLGADHEPRGLWLHAPAPPDDEEPDRAVPLLVVFDGEAWFGELGLSRALDAARSLGRLPPLAVLGVENRSRLDRIDVLGANAGFLHALAEEALPWAESELSRSGLTVAGPAGRIIAGQSLGGLSALTAMLDVPGVFGAALAHSPSLWWRPGGSSPRDLGRSPEPDWITARFAATPGPSGPSAAGAPSPRIRIDVGGREGLTVPHAHRLREVLLERGWDTTLEVFDGGHDFACWRGALFEGLAALHAQGTRRP